MTKNKQACFLNCFLGGLIGGLLERKFSQISQISQIKEQKTKIWCLRVMG